MLCTTTNSRLNDFRCDVGIIMVSEKPDLDAMPASTVPHLRKLLELGDFTGQFNTSSLIYTNDKNIPRFLYVGTGKPEEIDIERIRQSQAHGARTVSEAGFKSAVIPVPLSATPEEIEAAATAIPLSLYQFHKYKTKLSEADKKRLTAVTFLTEDTERKTMVERAVQHGNIYAKGTILTRDLSNEPGNYMTPTRLAETAETIAAESGLNCQIFDKAMLQHHGFGGLLAVAKGSVQEPRLIVLEYLPPDDGYNDTVVYIGKSITYDTGGVNLKPADGLIDMKGDKAGGAAVIAAMRSIGQLKPQMRVIGILPAAENHVGPEALKPDDIIKMYSGNTVEVVNTDAEGRLVLADAHHFAAQYEPDAVINLATLTGAVITTFGHRNAGAMTNDRALLAKLQAAAEKTHERIAELPLDGYDEDVKSTIADVKNLGEGRTAGAIAGGTFLNYFVNDNYPWVHLDIAGTAWNVKNSNYIPESGASGWGAGLLTRFVENWHTDR